ncbi:MAG: HAD family hydrolase [Leptolyngbyaceae bacterium]|nr:HAD family hydrolase [Leptolyngbyaceae bacterium]
MMLDLKLVLFDMAGTTIRDDQEVEQCFMDAADATGLVVERDRIVGMMVWSKRRVFQTLWAEQWEGNPVELEQRVDASYSKFKGLLEDHYRTQPVVPTEGCLELFDWLRQQGIAIGLNTGFYREVTTIILRRLGWDRGLDATYVGSPSSPIQVSVTPSEIYNQEGRPAPYMIQKAMYHLGIRNPQQVMVVGDTPSDLEAGSNAHCGWVVGVTNGTHTRDQLIPHPHHELFDSLSDLRAYLVNRQRQS